MLIKSQRQRRISDQFVWGIIREIYIIRNAIFIELLALLWLKEGMLKMEMELEARVYTVQNSEMKICTTATLKEALWPWQTQALTPIIPNSTLPSVPLTGLMGTM